MHFRSCLHKTYSENAVTVCESNGKAAALRGVLSQETCRLWEYRNRRIPDHEALIVL